MSHWEKPLIPDWLAGVATIGGITLLTLLLIYGCTSYSCEDTGKQSGLETKYSIWSGCYVKLKDRWVPAERWREIEDK